MCVCIGEEQEEKSWRRKKQRIQEEVTREGRAFRSKTRTPIPIKKEASRKREGCSGWRNRDGNCVWGGRRIERGEGEGEERESEG